MTAILSVLLLGVAAGINRGKINAVGSIFSRTERPAGMLAAYFVGGAGVSLAAGLVMIFVLKTGGVGPESPLPALIMIIIGGVLILMAVVIASGLGERMRAAWEGAHHDATDADTDLKSHETSNSGIGARLEERVPFLKKVSSTMDRIHESESPWIAWVSGVQVGMPNTIYLAAIALVVHAHFNALPQAGSLVVFNVLNFGVVLIALSAVAMAPEWAGLNYLRIEAWITTHRRVVIPLVGLCSAAYLIVSRSSRCTESRRYWLDRPAGPNRAEVIQQSARFARRSRVRHGALRACHTRATGAPRRCCSP
jgi:Sap, sulfolipid-1-addressing protein